VSFKRVTLRMMIIKFLNFLKRNSRLFPFLTIAISLIIYNFFWDIIVTDRIISLNASYGATVWDMGAFYNTLWTIFHAFTFQTFITYMSSKPIAFFMSPLSSINSPFFFVYLQTFWISITVLPLYLIGYKKTGSKSGSLIISISYLLFFGIAGQNWFDVHFQTLFVPLFVSGYALQLVGHKRLGYTAIIFSGLVYFLYLFFAILFFIFLIMEEIRDKRSLMISRQAYVGLIFSIAMFAIMYLLSIHEAAINNSSLKASLHIVSGSLIGVLSSSIDQKIYAVLILLFPFLCLPLLSRKWIFFIIVYFTLMFVSGNSIYFFPNFIRLQYLGMIVPFLYIGTVEVLSNLEFSYKNGSAKDINKGKVFNPSFKLKLKVAVIIFILIVLLGTVFEPYGPLNGNSSTDFQMNQVTDYNLSLYDHYIDMVNLIPKNDPYILYQNNMPQIIYKDPTALTIYLFGEPYNYTYFIDGKWTNNVSYVIADPYSSWFTVSGSGNYSSNMYITLNHFISTGQYGILAEYDGLILLKKGYIGKPIIYGPENRIFTVQDLYSGFTDRNGNTSIYSSNLSGYQTLWYGPYTFLQPGNYVLTLRLKASNVSSLNKFQLRYSYMLNPSSGVPIDVELVNLTGKNLEYPDKWVNITLNIKAANFYDYVEFAGQSFDWSGNFSIGGISLKQSSR
jgi:uncharacterized membrane protein